MRVASLEEDPAFREEFMEWARRRQQGYQERQAAEASLAQIGHLLGLEKLWSRQYARGQDADAAARRHQTVFHGKPVRTRS